MRKTAGRTAGILPALLAFAVFGVSAMLLTLLGVKAYRKTVEQMEEGSSLRSALFYLANRIHSGDKAGEVELVIKDGTELLCFTETVDGSVYQTWVYAFDGWLREFATVEGNDGFDPSGGEKIAAVSDFSMKKEGKTFTFEAETADGERRQLSVTLRSDTP